MPVFCGVFGVAVFASIGLAGAERVCRGIPDLHRCVRGDSGGGGGFGAGSASYGGVFAADDPQGVRGPAASVTGEVGGPRIPASAGLFGIPLLLDRLLRSSSAGLLLRFANPGHRSTSRPPQPDPMTPAWTILSAFAGALLVLLLPARLAGVSRVDRAGGLVRRGCGSRVFPACPDCTIPNGPVWNHRL